MASKFRPRFYILFGIVLAVLVGCATTGQLNEVKKELEEVRQLAEMGAAGGVSANFYPTRSIAGSGTGSIGNISGVEDKDFSLSVLEEDSTYGNAAFPWMLDAAGGSGDDTNTPPNYVESADASDRWNLGGWVGKFMAGNNVYRSITSGPDSMTCFDVMGGFIRIGATLTVNLPSVANCADISGNRPNSPCVIFWLAGTYTLSINPHDDDRVVREGTAQSNGIDFDLDGDLGDYVAVCIDSADGWTTLGYSGTLSLGS